MYFAIHTYMVTLLLNTLVTLLHRPISSEVDTAVTHLLFLPSHHRVPVPHDPGERCVAGAGLGFVLADHPDGARGVGAGHLELPERAALLPIVIRTTHVTICEFGSIAYQPNVAQRYPANHQKQNATRINNATRRTTQIASPTIPKPSSQLIFYSSVHPVPANMQYTSTAFRHWVL